MGKDFGNLCLGLGLLSLLRRCAAAALSRHPSADRRLMRDYSTAHRRLTQKQRRLHACGLLGTVLDFGALYIDVATGLCIATATVPGRTQRVIAGLVGEGKERPRLCPPGGCAAGVQSPRELPLRRRPPPLDVQLLICCGGRRDRPAEGPGNPLTWRRPRMQAGAAALSVVVHAIDRWSYRCPPCPELRCPAHSVALTCGGSASTGSITGDAGLLSPAGLLLGVVGVAAASALGGFLAGRRVRQPSSPEDSPQTVAEAPPRQRSPSPPALADGTGAAPGQVNTPSRRARPQ